MKTLDLLNSMAELKKLSIENPDLPLVISASDMANIGNVISIPCSDICAYISKFIIYKNGRCKDRAFCESEKEKFEDVLFDDLMYEHPELDDDELYELFKKKINEYEPYWKKCITIHVNN